MFSLLATVFVIQLMAVASPGPDFIVCLKNTLTYNRAVGIWTALGFALGVLVHVTYCIFGIAILISQSLFWFNVIKYCGAAYLIYLGIKSLLSSNPSTHIDLQSTASTKSMSAISAIGSGFLTNLLNPKATMYFLGLFTVVIPPDVSYATMSGIIIIVFGLTFLWFAFVATVLTIPAIRHHFLRFERVLERVFGGMLILVGLKVGLSRL